MQALLSSAAFTQNGAGGRVFQGAGVKVDRGVMTDAINLWQYPQMWMKWIDCVSTVGIALLLLVSTAPVNAGRMFGKPATTSPALAPDWCFCARVCQVVGSGSSQVTVPRGQSLAICPSLHDETAYDNMANCGCTTGHGLHGSGPIVSPNR